MFISSIIRNDSEDRDAPSTLSSKGIGAKHCFVIVLADGHRCSGGETELYIISYEDRVDVSLFVGAESCCLGVHPCLASNSDADITFFVTVDDEAFTFTRAVLFWAPSPVVCTPNGNDSESLPLFSLFSATWDDADDSEEDFWTSLREDVVCIMLLFAGLIFFFRLNMFRRPHRGITAS